MKLAFLVLVHKQPDQVARLLDRLADPDTLFFVHVGFAEPDIHDELRSRLAGRADVRFLPRRRMHWGGFSLVRVLLDGLDAMFETAPDLHYALAISGQDYPLKPNEWMRAYLREHAGMSFLDHFRMPLEEYREGSLDWTLQRGGLDRIEYWHLHRHGRHVRFPNRLVPLPRRPRRLPAGLVPYGGQAWWCLSRETLDYVRRFVRDRPDVLRFFRFVDVPDESLFQTILLNSPLADTIVNDDLRYIVWQRGVSHPDVLTKDDFPALAATDDFFGRKFDVAVDAELLDRVDAELLGR